MASQSKVQVTGWAPGARCGLWGTYVDGGPGRVVRNGALGKSAAGASTVLGDVRASRTVRHWLESARGRSFESSAAAAAADGAAVAPPRLLARMASDAGIFDPAAHARHCALVGAAVRPF